MKTGFHFAVATLLAICFALFTTAASAQGIERMNRSYQEAPPLPLAPAPGAAFAGFGGNGARVWEATLADATIRRVIEKWALSGGWVFGLEHWAVDRDLPVTAQTTFQGDFRGAVRSLLASTEFTDLPLQPCFFSNSVLRVVPRSEVCDRMTDR